MVRIDTGGTPGWLRLDIFWAADIIIFIGLGLGGRRKGRLPAPKAAGALCTPVLRGPHRADLQETAGSARL